MAMDMKFQVLNSERVKQDLPEKILREISEISDVIFPMDILRHQYIICDQHPPSYEA